MKTAKELYESKGGAAAVASFMVKEAMPYDFKVKYAKVRIKEFITECDGRGLNTHVSVGGLDSITLFAFIRSLGLDIPGISVSCLEDVSIQKVHKEMGIERLTPAKKEDGTPWKKPEILQTFGFPVLSKEIAAKIELLQNPSEKNKTVRHAIITGETGEYGGHRKSSRMKMAQKWLDKFGGYENENEGVNYQIPDFKVSSKCCYYLKEKPCDDWAKEHNSVPFLGLMASEGGRRAKSLMINGCNYFGASVIRSCPFAIFSRSDVIHLACDLGVKIPEIYGDVIQNDDGTFDTTGAKRTGCSMCGFGIHLEKRPHRFDMLLERNPKEWDFWMNRCVTDENGNSYGWGHVLDYIGVPYNTPETMKQLTFSDLVNEVNV